MAFLCRAFNKKLHSALQDLAAALTGASSALALPNLNVHTASTTALLGTFSSAGGSAYGFRHTITSGLGSGAMMPAPAATLAIAAAAAGGCIVTTSAGGARAMAAPSGGRRSPSPPAGVALRPAASVSVLPLAASLHLSHTGKRLLVLELLCLAALLRRHVHPLAAPCMLLQPSMGHRPAWAARNKAGHSQHHALRLH